MAIAMECSVIRVFIFMLDFDVMQASILRLAKGARSWSTSQRLSVQGIFAGGIVAVRAEPRHVR